jgi:hypothetical protein
LYMENTAQSLIRWIGWITRNNPFVHGNSSACELKTQSRCWIPRSASPSRIHDQERPCVWGWSFRKWNAAS